MAAARGHTTTYYGSDHSYRRANDGANDSGTDDSGTDDSGTDNSANFGTDAAADLFTDECAHQTADKSTDPGTHRAPDRNPDTFTHPTTVGCHGDCYILCHWGRPLHRRTSD